MPKTVCKVFVSHSRAGADLCRKLLRLLHVLATSSTRFEFRFWDERAKLGETDLQPAIADAVSACNIGLLLVSPGYFESKMVNQHELPAFACDSDKPAIAVEVRSTMNAPGRQNDTVAMTLFRDGKRAFGDCTGRQQKLFAEKLFEYLETHCAELF